MDKYGQSVASEAVGKPIGEFWARDTDLRIGQVEQLERIRQEKFMQESTPRVFERL
jgi:hypothetical protein